MEELKRLVELAAQLFASDPSSPSVQLSWLEDRQMWYVSVRRYLEAYGRNSQVIASCSAVELETAVRSVLQHLETFGRFYV